MNGICPGFILRPAHGMDLGKSKSLSKGEVTYMVDKFCSIEAEYFKVSVPFMEAQAIYVGPNAFLADHYGLVSAFWFQSIDGHVSVSASRRSGAAWTVVFTFCPVQVHSNSGMTANVHILLVRMNKLLSSLHISKVFQ